MPIQGLDVSKFQGDNIDWDKVASSGAQFCLIRASDGTNQNNESKFGDNWLGARGAGLICGAYHLFRPALDAVDQANLFLAQFGNNVPVMEAGYLPAALDVEIEPASATVQNYLDGVKAWINTVEQNDRFKGLPTIIYTSQNIWNQIGDGTLGDHPLWVADYSEDPPRLPSDWTNWTFFQYTETGSVSGIDVDVDQDHFAGSRNDLIALTIPKVDSLTASEAGGAQIIRLLEQVQASLSALKNSTVIASHATSVKALEEENARLKVLLMRFMSQEEMHRELVKKKNLADGH